MGIVSKSFAQNVGAETDKAIKTDLKQEISQKYNRETYARLIADFFSLNKIPHTVMLSPESRT